MTDKCGWQRWRLAWQLYYYELQDLRQYYTEIMLYYAPYGAAGLIKNRDDLLKILDRHYELTFPWQEVKKSASWDDIVAAYEKYIGNKERQQS